MGITNLGKFIQRAPYVEGTPKNGNNNLVCGNEMFNVLPICRRNAEELGGNTWE